MKFGQSEWISRARSCVLSPRFTTFQMVTFPHFVFLFVLLALSRLYSACTPLLFFVALFNIRSRPIQASSGSIFYEILHTYPM